MPAPKIKAVLACDTREQSSYLPLFSRRVSTQIDFDIREVGLPEGDYAAYIHDDDIANGTAVWAVVERKSYSDLIGTITHGRARFENELARLTDYGFRALVIEADLPQIVAGYEWGHTDPVTGERQKIKSKVNPKSVIGSLIAFQFRYGIHVAFCTDRIHAASWTYRLLHNWILERNASRVMLANSLKGDVVRTGIK